VNAQPTEIAPDLELLASCRAGDAAAWRQLFDEHFEFLERISRRLGTPEAELDDVIQDTFIIAFRKLDSFQSGRFSTWLFRIAANVVSSKHRRRRIRATFQALFGGASDEPHAPAPDRAYESREAQQRVSQVLERMAPRKREVFGLYELEGLSGEEIAERIGCKVDTVWTRLHYARKDFERIARKRGLA
jgi:RNA polymerase sigma-70 factor (ECF subfamily)